MLYVTDINDAWIKRNIRPLYDNTQATPKSLFLDPAWDRSVDIVPGMVVMKTAGDNVTLLNSTANAVPYGLADIFEAPSLGQLEVTRAGLNAFPVWVLGPDAEFDIVNFKGKAFDDSLSWVDPGDGSITLISAYTSGAKRGQLCPLGTAGAHAVPIARLLAVNSSSSIRIGGLAGRAA